MFKAITSVIIALICTSCCSPYQVKVIDPTMLEEQLYEESCLFRPCATESTNCKWRPLLNLEFENHYDNLFKVGVSAPLYARHFMLSGNLNYLHGNELHVGYGLEGQVGFLPYDNTYTTFMGFEYKRVYGANNPRLLGPNLGVVIPFKGMWNIQVKLMYNYGMKDPFLKRTSGSVNFKIPLFHLF